MIMADFLSFKCPYISKAQIICSMFYIKKYMKK